MSDKISIFNTGVAYDYRSPFMRATIVRPDDTRFPLWTDLGLTPEQKESSGLVVQGSKSYLVNSLPYLQELTIEFQGAYLPIMKAKLVFPYRDGIAFLNSNLIEWGYSTLEVVIGYTGGTPGGPVFAGNGKNKLLSPVFEGVILVPEVEIGTQISVTLNAQGVGGYSAVNTTRTGGPYVGTRKELIENIFVPGPNEKVKRKLNVDFRKVELDLGSVEFDKLHEVVEVSPAGRSDWNIIFELLNEADCWMTLIGDTIVVTAKSDWSNAVSRIFRHYDFQAGDVSSSSNEYPILTASSTAPAIYAPADAIGAWSSDIDSGNPKKLIDHIVNHDNYPQNTSAKGNIGPAEHPNAPSYNKDTNDGLGFFVGSPNNPKWINQMQQDLRAWAGNIGIKLDVTTIGIPDLLPLEIIAIRGLGERMDNVNYGIFKIIHTLGTAGFTTYMECYSNVQGKIASELTPPQATGISSPPLPPPSVNSGDTLSANKVFANIDNKVRDIVIQAKKDEKRLNLQREIAQGVKKLGNI